MSILHRIFVSRHKHKKVYKKQKTAYKKFLGLKTLTGVLHTTLSRLHSTRLNKKSPKRKLVKKTTIKRLPRIRFSILRSLRLQARRYEVISAQRDIEHFISTESEAPAQDIAEEKFQAFLPQTV